MKPSCPTKLNPTVLCVHNLTIHNLKILQKMVHFLTCVWPYVNTRHYSVSLFLVHVPIPTNCVSVFDHFASFLVFLGVIEWELHSVLKYPQGNVRFENLIIDTSADFRYMNISLRLTKSWIMAEFIFASKILFHTLYHSIFKNFQEILNILQNSSKFFKILCKLFFKWKTKPLQQSWNYWLGYFK